MEYQTLLPLLLFVISFISFIIFKQDPKSAKLPPGPRPFPIIGNILELGNNPHQTLTNLSKIYGPLMTLKLGKLTTIVISSPEIAKEALHKNDLIFAGRTVPHTLQTLGHHKVSMAFMPPTAKWSILRRACNSNIFSTQNLNLTQISRENKVKELLDHIDECCRKNEALDIGQAAFKTVVNFISNTLFSIDFTGFSSDSSGVFKQLICGLTEEAGRPNVADFFPFLRLFDPQRARARMDEYAGKLLGFIDGIIEERIRDRGDLKVEGESDVLDSFIDLMEEDDSQLSRLDVLHLFGDLFVAGVDTTSITIEWAMVELLRNPNNLEKARKELHKTLGKDLKLEESHLSNLPFLRAIVKETLRLHPPVPLLVPRKSLDDAQLCGFTIPKNAQILVNIWAMGRDSNIWPNPNSFVPERFLDREINFKGRDFELIPFGAGRRMCPGLPFADRAVHLVLAFLLRSYDWKLADGLKPEEVNMTEKFGLTLRSVQPLRVIPIKV